MTATNTILIVDDEPAVRDVMARWLSTSGAEVKTAANAHEALATVQENPCDIAVIDVRMPGPDGVWLKDELHRTHPHTAVVLATAYTDLVDGRQATAGIADLLVKPFARDRFMLALDRGRQWRKQALDDLRWHAQLSAEVRDRTSEICHALAAADSDDELETLTALVDERAPAVMPHSERVSRFAVAVARELDLDLQLLPIVALVARVHDVGKAAMPEPLLRKPSAHTAGEQAMMRRHVEIGAEILAATRTLGDVAPLVLATHEWFGGGGYPLQLAGEDIPLVSRIIGVVDAHDAMTQNREYRPALDRGAAIAELLRCARTQFDPAVVTAFLAVLGRA
jgi:cyclic di-GMP phosphodiesterase